MMKRKIYIYSAVISVVICACSDDRYGFETGSQDVTDKEIIIQGTIDQSNITRANDSGFADGDRIGIYAVNFTKDMNPGSLCAEGNLINNVAFTFDEDNYKWTGDKVFYFQDDKTPVDFYGYYPYLNSIENVNSLPFSIESNQAREANGNSLSGYESSDFLWAKSSGFTPSQSVVNLLFQHLLAGVQVTLVEGEGFADGEWNTLEKSVLICNTYLTTTINLQTGTLSEAKGNNKSIITCRHNNDFRGVVVPQTVSVGETLLAITVDGQTYNFKKDVEMRYLSSKMHKFSVKVNKREAAGAYEFSLLDESITAWESDPMSHNGLAKEYVCVNVPECGKLKESLANLNLNPKEIKNLKLEGYINYLDFDFIRSDMPYLEAINLKNVDLGPSSLDINTIDLKKDALPFRAFRGMKTLTHIVFPDKLKYIGPEAFLGTHLSGSLDLPEGLEYIGGLAFKKDSFDNVGDGGEEVVVYNNLTGQLTLPSTLKYIGEEAFYCCDFTGSLLLPEGLEFIGDCAFLGCNNLSGELHLPHSLKQIGRGAFNHITNIRGKLEIPKSLTEIDGFGGLNINSVGFNDIATKINEGAFRGAGLSGELKIPETITYIGPSAFAETKLTNIIFPSKLEFIDHEVCADNKFLQDTIVIPHLIETIGESAFRGCEKLEAIVLSSKLRVIKRQAFAHCSTLNYIQCLAKEPPTLDESAFEGVNKDNFTVEVPEESVDAYRNAKGWSEFKRIAACKNFVARPSKYNVLNKGGKKEIILNADANWTMTECPDWCDITPKSGSKKTVLTLTIKEMQHGSATRSGTIKFKLDNSEDYTTHINVTQCDYEYDEDYCLQLQKATKGAGIDLFFVGDGYDAFDISNGSYLKHINQEVEYFFAVEPYQTYRDYFNVYTAFALSEDSGVESVNHWRNTKFHVSLNGKDGRLGGDSETAFQYCESVAIPISSRDNPYYNVIVLSNTEVYEGVTNVGTRDFCAFVTRSTEDYPNDARGLVQHEAGGHGIGHLADEYIYHQAYIQDCKCTCCEHIESLHAHQATGFGLNISSNGKYNEVPWSHLINHPSYGDIVDIYEGGYFHSRGVYRSEYNSCMNNNVPYFSSWSRQLIVERIMQLAGETFDINMFYANDSRAVGQDLSGTRRGSATGSTNFQARHGNAPIIISNYSERKKGGKK